MKYCLYYVIIYIFFSVSRSQSQLRLNYHSEQVRVINYLYFSEFRQTGNLRLLHSPYTAQARARNGLEHRLGCSWEQGKFCIDRTTSYVRYRSHACFKLLTLLGTLSTFGWLRL